MLAVALPLFLALASPSQAGCPGIEPWLDALDSPARCLTPALRGAWMAARERGQEACLAAELQARGLPARAFPTRFPPAPEGPPRLGAAPGKVARNPYGAPNSLESANFAVHWGGNGGVSRADAEDLLEEFEASWIFQVDGMGMPAPYATEAYKFTVYVGDTGDGAPSSHGAGGYYTVDDEGFPFIVIALGSMHDPDWEATTVAHEFHHACQHATGNYNGGTGAWYWESTATWVEGEQYPDVPYYAAFLFGFAFLPHLALDFFDYPDTGAIEEYHQYGSFIFPRYVSEQVADQQLVRDVWLHGSAWGDPMDTFDDLLQERGTTFLATWGDFLAHNATWDYADGDIYDWYLDYYADYYPDVDHRITAVTYGSGSEEWSSGSPLPPQRFGANTIAIRYPEAGTLHVEFEGHARGSWDSPAQWEVRVVVDGAGSPTYYPLVVEDGVGSLELPDLEGLSGVFLTIGAWSANGDQDEEFDYRYRMWFEGTGPAEDDTAEGVDPDPAPGPCGCAAGPRSLGVLPLLLAGLLLRRRVSGGPAPAPAPRLPRRTAP